LKNNPQITRLVSHSLGSAVANTLNENFPNRFQTTTYATPAIKPKRRGNKTLNIGITAIPMTLCQF